MTQVAKSKDISAQSKLPLNVLKEMWENSRPLGELILLSGLPRTRLYKLALAHNWRRAANYEKTGKAADDPSEEEIAERAAEIRANWPEGESDRRYRGKKREEAYTHTLTFDPRSGSFSPCRPIR